MYRLLILNNDLKTIKKYCNVFLTNFDNIRLVGIAANETELSFLYENSLANMIILSMEDFKNPSINSIIENIQNKIIICNRNEKFRDSKGILYIPKEYTDHHILEKLNKFISKTTESNIKKIIRKLLKQKHFDFKLKGTHYILDSIIYSYINKNDHRYEILETYIYPYIAKKYNVPEETVKWAVLRSVDNANYTLSFLGLNTIEKITPKSLILDIVSHL